MLQIFVKKIIFVQTYISQHDSKRDEKYKYYVIDIRYQKQFSSPQNVKTDLKQSTAASPRVPAIRIDYPLFLTKTIKYQSAVMVKDNLM